MISNQSKYPISQPFPRYRHRSEIDASKYSTTHNSRTVHRNVSCKGSADILRRRPIQSHHPFIRLRHRLRTRRPKLQTDARESEPNSQSIISPEPLVRNSKARGPRISREPGLRSRHVHSPLRPNSFTWQLKTSHQQPFSRRIIDPLPTPSSGGGSPTPLHHFRSSSAWSHRGPRAEVTGWKRVPGAGTNTCPIR